MRRTASETQLYEDEAEADYKDFMFYSRVVNGIISKQPCLYQDDSLKHENHQCLQNIVRARHDNDATNVAAASAAAANGGQAVAGEQTLVSSAFQQERSQRMIRFTTQALAVSEGHEHYYDEDHDDNDDDDDSEEGIFDLEL
jgi:hypothetical protein